ncbi:helix-turn-helix transcriptional regulator [Streptomyces turgidiscabies]|uniref:helix-turn-helix transcriptional regulator n=1 Tax=Streptomyces turgidiscabies TaxID=85558 RepID=UPI0038F77AA3
MARHFSGQLLRETRKAAGISIARLAIGVDRSVYTIQEYERGRATPSVPTLVAMADALGRPVDDLLVEEEAHAA